MDTNEYKDKPFTTKIAVKILRETMWKRRHQKTLDQIVKYVTEHHKEREGTIVTGDTTTKLFVKRALHILESEGLACNISKSKGLAYNFSKGMWEFPKHGQCIFGQGNEWVYLYYYDTYKREAEQNGQNVWRCKIGRAERTPEKTVKSQTRAAPEAHTIALLIRTHNCRVLEKMAHKSLELVGKHLNDTPGEEWFLTNPDKVAKFYVSLDLALLEIK